MTLLAAYAFDEGAGVSAAEVDGGQAISGVPAWGAGRHGSAMRVDGVPGPSVAPFVTSGPFTIMVDAFVVGDGVGGLNMILSGATFGNAQIVNGGGALEWYLGPYPTTTPVPVGQWVNLAFTGDGTTRRAYVDGVLASNGAAASAALSGTDSIRLGGYYAGGYAPNVRLDNLRIYNTALTAAEVAEVAGTAVGASEPPPPENVPPVARAGADKAADTGSVVTLSGSTSSDSDGTIASYTWRQVSGTVVALSGSGASRSFTAPATPGSLVFGLTVTDNAGATSAEDTVTVTVVEPPAQTPGGPLLDAYDLAYMRETQAEARPTEAELVRMTQGTTPSGGRGNVPATPEPIQIRLDGKEKAIPQVVTALAGSAKPVKVVMDMVDVRGGDIIRVGATDYQVITDPDPDEWATALVVWTKKVKGPARA
jgi:hypothetical protein